MVDYIHKVSTLFIRREFRLYISNAKKINNTIQSTVPLLCIKLLLNILLNDDFPQTQENAVFEYAEKHKAECFDQLADYVEILDFPEMTLSNWKIEKGRIALKGWFSAMLKLQQRNAEAIENGAGSITTECKGFDFSITLGDDFKIATDKETQKEIIEIKLQGS